MFYSIFLYHYFNMYNNRSNVVGLVRKFDEKLFNRYDIPARDKIKSVLSFVTDNPNPLKQDLVINLNTCKYRYLELQVCSTWVNEKYPHKNVFIYSRKINYPSDTLFLTLNKNLKYGFLFDTVNVNRNKPKRLKKYSREFVYNIPWADIVQVSIDNLDQLTFELL